MNSFYIFCKNMEGKIVKKLIVFGMLLLSVLGFSADIKGNERSRDIKKITASREALGEFAPKFAEINDDVLFGEVWSREDKLSAKNRSIVTISALISGGNFEQLPYHIQKGKENGITKEEISEIITHLSFYVGWPKAWSAFYITKEIYKD